MSVHSIATTGAAGSDALPLLIRYALWATMLGASIACNGQPDPTNSNANETNGEPRLETLAQPSDAFVRHIVDTDAHGPAFADVGDVNGDGKLDLVVSQFGHRVGDALPMGRVAIYEQGEVWGSWTRRHVFREDAAIVWPNQVNLHDLDEDGDLDVLVPHGFLVCTLFSQPCGGLSWFEQEEGGWKRHTLVEAGAPYFYHSAVVLDADGDGVTDLVTPRETFDFVESHTTTQWFKGRAPSASATAERFDVTPQVLTEGGGTIPRIFDIDGDGDDDLITAEFFGGESFVWLERQNGSARWQRHVIDGGVGPSIEIVAIPNLFGDGRPWAVGSNHSNIHEDEIESAVFGYQIPDDPAAQPWPRTQFSTDIEATPNEGFERNLAPGVLDYGDIDGDGDIDLAVSGDGDPDVYWLEQRDGKFVTHVLQPGLPQAGSITIRDLDGDGSNEVVVSGFEHDAVFIFEFRGTDGH